MIRLLVDGIPTEIGGIGTIIINLVKQLEKDVFDISFLLTYDSAYEEVIRALGNRIVKVPAFGKRPMEYYTAVRNHFKKNKYDFVWINNTSKVNLWLPKLAKQYGDAKIIFHSHGEKHEFTGIRSGLVNLVERLNQHRFYKLLDIACACSKNSAAYFYNTERLQGKPVHIIHNAIDVTRFRYQEDLRQKLLKQEKISDCLVLGTIGRLAEVKNQSFLIRLLAKLNQTNSVHYHLYLVGDGPLMQSLKDLAHKYGQNANITFTGNTVSPEEYLQLFDIFLLPSLFEGMPLVLVEAQAAGLPCLVSSSVSRETKLSDDVFFLSLDNISAWITQINQLLPSDRSEKYRSIVCAGYDIYQSGKEFESILLKGLN